VVGAEANLSAQFGRMDLGGEFYVAEAPVAVLQLRVGAPARSAALLAVLDRDLGEVPGSLLQRSQNDWRGRPLAARPLAGLPWKGIGLAALALCGLVAGVMVWNWLLRRRVGRATGALRRANQALSAEIAERARAEGELAELNRRLEANVAERTADLDRKARELEAANLQLRQLDELKSEFLSSVSHELRTPLTSVRGFARLVSRDLERHFGPLTAEDEILDARLERVQSNLGVILDEGERLTRLIDDVLDLSRIEAGRMEWNDTDVDTSALLLKGARAAQGLFLNSPGVRFEVAIAPDLPRLRIDPDRLEQVLANLLGNAAKFTERGMVALSAWEQRGEIFVRVEDTGAGIPGEDLEHVFDKFRQSRRRASLTDKPQGTGLGLAICREIVEHYGGGIRAESEPGLGSAFLFRLPVPAPIAGTVSEPVHAPEAPDTEEPGTPKAGTDGSAAAIGPEAEAGSTVAAEPAAAEPAGTAAPGAPSGARGRKAGNGTWALAAEREREAGA
jgi:signal transduction histidine kinase